MMKKNFVYTLLALASLISIVSAKPYTDYLNTVHEVYAAMATEIRAEISSLEEGDELYYKQTVLWVVDECAAFTHNYVIEQSLIKEGDDEPAENDKLGDLAKTLANEAVIFSANAEVSAAQLHVEKTQIESDIKSVEADIKIAEGEALLPLLEKRSKLVREREDLFYKYLDTREKIVMGYVEVSMHTAAFVFIAEESHGSDDEAAKKASHSHNLMIASAARAYATLLSERGVFASDEDLMNAGLHALNAATLIQADAIKNAEPYLDAFVHDEL